MVMRGRQPSVAHLRPGAVSQRCDERPSPTERKLKRKVRSEAAAYKDVAFEIAVAKGGGPAKGRDFERPL